MLADELPHFAVDHEEVIDHFVKSRAVDETIGANRLPLVISQVVQQVEPVWIQIVGESLEADAAGDRRSCLVDK